MNYMTRIVSVLALALATSAGWAAQLVKSAPPLDRIAITKAVNEAHALFKDESRGKNADHIPNLARVPSTLFGIAVVTTTGEVVTAGDASYAFAIESLAKPFTAALVMQTRGAESIIEEIGVEPTGTPFNSVTAVQLLPASLNPIVTAGAMMTVSLVPGVTSGDRWQSILGWFSQFAGEKLNVNEEVYQSEAATNKQYRDTAELLRRYGRFYADPLETCDVYAKQCAISVTAKQLAVMGATLANSGVNPVTKERLMDPRHVPRLLAVMMMAGFYDEAGWWAWNVGLPAKTGVSGGIVAIAPGRAALVAFSPPLDGAGNSVRGAKALHYVARKLGLNVFSNPAAMDVRDTVSRPTDSKGRRS